MLDPSCCYARSVGGPTHRNFPSFGLMAAGVAYYAVLSLFPLTLLLLSIMRLFTDSATARANLENFFSVYLPDSVGFVDQISGQDAELSGLLGIVGVIGLIPCPPGAG